MSKEVSLLERIYKDPCYMALCRAVGYKGCTYRDLVEHIEGLAKVYGKTRVESASWHLVTFEGQMTCNPKPLADVKLRSDVRRYCWQLLGPPPEVWDTFYQSADGTPMPEHAAKMAELGRPRELRKAKPTGRAKPAATPEKTGEKQPATKRKKRGVAD